MGKKESNLLQRFAFIKNKFESMGIIQPAKRRILFQLPSGWKKCNYKLLALFLTEVAHLLSVKSNVPKTIFRICQEYEGRLAESGETGFARDPLFGFAD